MFSSNTPSIPLVANIDGNGNNNGWADGSWLWFIIVIFALFGGWGNGFGGFGGNRGGEPCATQADVRAAVDQQTLISKLDQQTYGLADSTYALNTSLMNGFHGVDNAICNLGYNVQSGFNNIGHQISDCCCTTQRAIDGVNYNMATQTNAIQNTLCNNTRDIIDNANANNRAVLDFLVNDKIATLQAENQSLRTEKELSNQNAVLQAAMDANTAEILRRTAPLPVPSYPASNLYRYYNCNNACGCNSCGC